MLHMRDRYLLRAACQVKTITAAQGDSQLIVTSATAAERANINQMQNPHYIGSSSFTFQQRCESQRGCLLLLRTLQHILWEACWRQLQRMPPMLC